MIYAAPEHEFEASHGLPSALPKGETILWQGSPDTWSLARHAFHVNTLAAYFALILVLRGLLAYSDGVGAATALISALMLLPLALLALGLVMLLAHLAARSSVYTLTSRRVVMRIGIVLNITFNLPLVTLQSAGMKIHRDGTGDIPLQLSGEDNIAYPHLWPHARPWQIKRTQPMLRSVPHAARVGALLAEAAARASPSLAASQPMVNDADSTLIHRPVAQAA
jgi:Bacterial PH domain